MFKKRALLQRILKQAEALLWQKVAQAGSLLTFLLMPLRKPGMGIWDDALPVLSPYQTNPLGMAPIRYILNTVVDEAVLSGGVGPELFVNAVNVQTGNSRVFGPADISTDALLASACAPLSYQAVQIDGESYWDGSYASNPPLSPLYEPHLDCDILLVELTPLNRTETPMSAKNIVNRINELASINGLLAEFGNAARVGRGRCCAPRDPCKSANPVPTFAARLGVAVLQPSDSLTACGGSGRGGRSG